MAMSALLETTWEKRTPRVRTAFCETAENTIKRIFETRHCLHQLCLFSVYLSLLFVEKTSYHLWTLHPPTKPCLKTVLCIEVIEKKHLRLCQWNGRKFERASVFVSLGMNLGCVPPRSSPGSCEWGSGGQKVRNEGIHSSVVFHLAGSRGYSTAAEGLWRLEELATDQKFISLSPGLAPKVCEDKRICCPSADTTEAPSTRL